MYIKKSRHILSATIMMVAAINLMGECASGLLRMILPGGVSFTPDMLDASRWRSELVVFAFRLVSVCLVFYVSSRRVSALRGLVPEEDEEDMARLQREMIPDRVSTLTIRSIQQLLTIWAAILIGVQVVYEITSVAYQSFVAGLTGMVNLTDPASYTTYVALYNSTHGFKYIGMLIAICIGIFTTGVFLRDRFLLLIAGALGAVFLAAFLLLQSTTVVLPTRSVGIVWTSVIFHLLQTGGLFVFALYLRLRYRGT